MSKKLNIIEAMKMPIGTRFELSNDDTTVILKAHEEGGECLYWENETGSLTQVYITDETINAKYTPIQQPVSFMEIVNSDKKCKVDFSNIGLPKHWDDRILKFKNLNYISFGQLMYDLSNCCGTDVLRKIFKEAKWYIEESEADSND